MPARMHHAQPREIQPQRQRLKPIRDLLLPRCSFDDIQERLMLLAIPRLVMIPQELARVLGIRSHPRDGVKLMIAQNALRRTRFNHRSNQVNGLHLLGSAIDEIADEDRGAVRMTPSAGGFGIAELQKECDQFIELAVDIADDVKGIRHGSLTRREGLTKPLTLSVKMTSPLAEYSSSGRAVRASMHSPGDGCPEARLQSASRILGQNAFEFVVTSCDNQFPPPCRTHSWRQRRRAARAASGLLRLAGPFVHPCTRPAPAAQRRDSGPPPGLPPLQLPVASATGFQLHPSPNPILATAEPPCGV